MATSTEARRTSGIARPDSLYIAGKWVAASGDRRVTVITPSTEEVFIEVAEAEAEDVDRAVAAARAAFDDGPWPRMSHADRAACLRAMADGLRARAADLGHIWTSEVGALAARAGLIAPAAGAAFDAYAGLADTFAFEERHHPAAGGDTGLLVREAVGVVAAIIPWNGPLMLITHKLAPALLAGCSVIIKASPEAPGAALVVAEVAEQIGLPAGVINVVTAEREVSERLVSHPGVDKVTFTGSNAAGRRIGAICGDRIARGTLELGGKSAAVILDDYDVATAAQSIAASARIMCGQICSSLTRIIVTRHRHDALVEALAAAFGATRVGDPFDPATQMGPLAMGRQRDRVEDLIARGRHEGAQLATGGKRPSGLDRGFYIEPTVFGHVDNSMTIAREEIFGPVLSVIPADGEAQAIDIANDSIFGLNASVFTEDADRAYAVARQLRSGTVGHNSFRTDFSIAFGGFKQSGIGREGGREGLMHFLETKTIILDAPPTHLAPKAAA